MKLGKKSEEGSVKLYQGVASLQVIAVNPTKAEMEKIVGRDLQNEPEYNVTEDNGNTGKRITFWCKTTAESAINNGIDIIIPFSITLMKVKRETETKVQVFDKYGRFAWPTKEEFETKSIPQYSNGPARICNDYVAACPGLEQMFDFLKKWLNIPNVEVYNSTDKTYTPYEHPEDCEMSLDLNKIFNGDLSELKELVDAAKEYCFKAVIGIRTDDKGYQHMNVYTRRFMKNGMRTYDSVLADITSSQSAGSYPTTEFSIEPLHEYSPKATSFTQTSATQSSVEAPSPWQ